MSAAAAAAAAGRLPFPSISSCDPSNRGSHAAAADLDGTLLVSRSSFPYFFLLAVVAGSLLRGLTLLLFSPAILFLYRLVSEAAGIQLMIFISVAGIPMRDVERVARAVLPRFYAADVREDSWRAFRACGKRKVVVTANPVVMVEAFVREQLGGDKVLGTELGVDRRTGRATGLVTGRGVLVGARKREAVVAEFGEERLPELGLGDRDSDHDFMALCKEGYMVPPDPTSPRVPPTQLDTPIVFHDGRLVRRPEPRTALLTFLYLLLAFPLALIRLLFLTLRPSLLPLCGVSITVRGHPPPPNSLLVANHRSSLDILILSAALRRPVGLTGGDNDVVVFPEGTTCRGRHLLKFGGRFAGLSRRVAPVAVGVKGEEVFYGTAARGWGRVADGVFLLMNPRVGFEVEFLEVVVVEEDGRKEEEVAERVQELVGAALGFECLKLTARDKEVRLGAADGGKDD